MGEEDSQWKEQDRPRCRGMEGYAVAGEDKVRMFWRRKRRQERLAGTRGAQMPAEELGL